MRPTWEIDKEGRFTSTLERRLPPIRGLQMSGQVKENFDVTALQGLREPCGDQMEHRVVRYRGHIDRRKRSLKLSMDAVYETCRRYPLDTPWLAHAAREAEGWAS